MDYIKTEDYSVPHDFIRQHITFILEDESKYNIFLKDFEDFLINQVLSNRFADLLKKFLDGEQLESKELRHLTNSLKRVFSNKEHYKGLIGEHLFAFYYINMVEDFIWCKGPKGSSSAEPGIDFVTFSGDETNRHSINMTVWETKTTKNRISTRSKEISDFFGENMSFEENIDLEITALQERFKDKEDSELKFVIGDLHDIVLNREERFRIGAAGVTSNGSTSNDTFKQFANCFSDELSKEQRLVNFLFIELLDNLLDDLEGRIWRTLNTI